VATERIITLLTDFGTHDTFVGVMKGVILGIAPAVRIVDLTHAVPAQDVHAAAYHLATAVPYFPEATIHVAVVDPGVGSERHALAVETPRAVFVAPDNGVLSRALDLAPPRRIVRIENTEFMLPRVSTTFHGRDIFAPAAAHLAAGVPLSELGPEIADLVLLSPDAPRVAKDRRIRGRVQHIDRFGNLVTNIPAGVLPPGPCRITAGAAAVDGLSPSYAAAGRGSTVALVGSHGFLEIAVRDGSAAKTLDVHIGDGVNVDPLPPG
jgi:S-adenosylmethionine hydrolase